MSNLKRVIILLFVAFFLITGFAVVNHHHNGKFPFDNDKGHCSICVYIANLNGSIVTAFIFILFLSCIFKRIEVKSAVLFDKHIFLPFSQAPPVLY